MPKYLIAWTEENWYNITIDAPSKSEAIDTFYAQKYDEEDVIFIGCELQDSVEVMEV